MTPCLTCISLVSPAVSSHLTPGSLDPGSETETVRRRGDIGARIEGSHLKRDPSTRADARSTPAPSKYLPGASIPDPCRRSGFFYSEPEFASDANGAPYTHTRDRGRGSRGTAAPQDSGLVA